MKVKQKKNISTVIFTLILFAVGLLSLGYQLYYLVNHVFHDRTIDSISFSRLIPHLFTIVICMLFAFDQAKKVFCAY